MFTHAKNQTVKKILITSMFFILYMLLNGPHARAVSGPALSTTFPPNDRNGKAVYLTIGEGEFNVQIAGAAILSDTPGTVTITITHGGWCNSDGLDVPGTALTTYPYKATDFVVFDVSGSSGNYSLGTERTRVNGTNTRECSTAGNKTLSFNLNSYLPSVNKYAAVIVGSILFKPANYTLSGTGGWTFENSFRFSISSSIGAAMTLTPPGITASLYSFSNKLIASTDSLNTSFKVTTPCSMPDQNVTIDFFDVDDYTSYVSARGNYQSSASYPSQLSIYAQSGPNGSAYDQVHAQGKLNGGNGEWDSTFRGGKISIPFKAGRQYEIQVNGLSKPNSIAFNFSANVDTLFASENCPPPNTAPSGSINVSCSASGLVTISSATVTDKEGGLMTIYATKPDGTRATGSANVSANVSTNVSFTSSNTFNGTQDGVRKTISGRVTDPGGLYGTISGNYTCNQPPLAMDCTLDSFIVESNQSFTPIMTINRTDTGTTNIAVIPSIVVNGVTYTNAAVTMSALSSSSQTFTAITLAAEKEYAITGTVKKQSDNTVVANCTASTVNVVRKPFFTVTKGDLLVGGKYPSGSPSLCSNSATPTEANVYSWATVNSPADRKGASAEHVANIYKAAKEFYTANTITAPSSIPAKKWLTIANNASSGITLDWGGNNSLSPITCLTDFYATTKYTTTTSLTSPGTYNIPSGKTGQEEYSGNLILNGATSFNGNFAMYVTGNVYINSNIQLNESYAIKSDIRFFALIVKGNIYVAPGVTRLDGMYVAQPNGASTGLIYTCGKNSAGVFSAYLQSEIYNNCKDNKLTFNGIVQAKEIKLHRSFGSLTPNTPAEVFNGLPALYLATPPFQDTTSSSTIYDSAASLPPLL